MLSEKFVLIRSFSRTDDVYENSEESVFYAEIKGLVAVKNTIRTLAGESVGSTPTDRRNLAEIADAKLSGVQRGYKTVLDGETKNLYKQKRKRRPPAASDFQLPAEGFAKLAQVLAVFPVSKAQFYAGIKKGIYPAPVKLGERSVGWRVEAIRQLIASL